MTWRALPRQEGLAPDGGGSVGQLHALGGSADHPLRLSASLHGASLLELPWCIRALSQLMQGRTYVARSAIGQRGERKCAGRSGPYGRQRTVCMKTGEHAYSNTNRQSCSVPCNRVRKGSRREVSLQEALHCRSRLHHFCAPRLQRRGINSKVKSMDGSGVPCAPTTFLLLQLCEEGVTIL